MSEPMSSGKKKNLMLTVDSDVVEKAKALGINISEMTEGILKGFVFQADRVEREAFYQEYEEMFDLMVPLLKEYVGFVQIGRRTVFDDNGQPDHDEAYTLNGDGEIWVEDWDVKLGGLRDIETWALHDAKTILANFVKALASAKERRKEEMEALEMAKRVILAMTESLRKPESEIRQGKER
jgi:Post-segregation antitoxin CcdA